MLPFCQDANFLFTKYSANQRRCPSTPTKADLLLFLRIFLVRGLIFVSRIYSHGILLAMEQTSFIWRWGKVYLMLYSIKSTSLWSDGFAFGRITCCSYHKSKVAISIWMTSKLYVAKVSFHLTQFCRLLKAMTNRISIKEMDGKMYIRANQGHSIEVLLL